MKAILAIFTFLIFQHIGFAQQAFITTWKTDNAGQSNSTSITIPTTGGGYNYDVDWDNDGVFDELGITGNVAHNFGVAGTCTIRIRGSFPRIYINYYGDRLKIISIDQWGSIAWESMEDAFRGASNLSSSALDVPDLSNVTNTSSMFQEAPSFNGDVSKWNLSNVRDVSALITNASAPYADPASSYNGDVSE